MAGAEAPRLDQRRQLGVPPLVRQPDPRRAAGGSGTRSKNTRSWRLSGRSPARRSRSAPELRLRRRARALRSRRRRARAPRTRGGGRPDTKWSSPIRYTSIGGIASPRRRAAAIRSQRPRSAPDAGRNSRSNSSGRRSTVPTIESSGIDCTPRSRSLRRPSAATTSSNGSIIRHVVGLVAEPRDDAGQRAAPPLAAEAALGVLVGESGAHRRADGGRPDRGGQSPSQANWYGSNTSSSP